jgi:hypothetical protein
VRIVTTVPGGSPDLTARVAYKGQGPAMLARITGYSFSAHRGQALVGDIVASA